MIKVIFFSIIQSLLLTLGQVFLKISLVKMPKFGWNREFWGSLITNWHFAVCGVFFAFASILWMWMLKRFPFSIVYPLTSISYLIGILFALLLFNESIPLTRWLGVALIIVGCMLIAR